MRRAPLPMLMLSLLSLGVADARGDGRRDHERACAALAAGEIRPLAGVVCAGERLQLAPLRRRQLDRYRAPAHRHPPRPPSES
ncbi:hypothetical protein [Roseomonas sp. AR75]|uniref:hypothetical protein n=1 Tax=Roseomonas sp. AR75 TaxID=2562311 RepID=UPI0014856712|nr:hypothetical protein [Roseomonas sp. AR75]